MKQHCGKMLDHKRHTHKARPKAKLLPCVCNQWPCVCPAPVWLLQKKRWFLCPGKIVTEGTEPPKKRGRQP